MTTRIEYIGASFDGSGYGEAARGYIAALADAGADVRLRFVSFEQVRPDLGEFGGWMASRVDTEPTTTAQVRVLHTTPDNWPGMLGAMPEAARAVPTVGYCAWETDQPPAAWIQAINSSGIRMLLVPSRQNVEAFRSAGVSPSIPIHRLAHAVRDIPTRTPPSAFVGSFNIDTNVLMENKAAIERATNTEISVSPGATLPRDGRYRFLSIFQWTERKNPLGLLKAYLTEFRDTDQVSLVLKTYLLHGGPEERKQIKSWIDEVKRGLWLTHYPRVEVIVQSLSSADIHQLVHDCDAYVSLHRQEGFGLPIAEAMMAGKPVIATGFGGPAEFGLPIDCQVGYQKTPVFGMPWATYSGRMSWAEPDLSRAKEMMRGFYASKSRTDELGAACREAALRDFAPSVVGAQMMGLLNEAMR